MGATSQAVLVRAVAALGEPSIRAISPKMPPGESVSTTLPSRSISISPERITYEDDVARSERCGWEARIGKKLEIDCSDRHARYTTLPPVADKP